MNRPRFSVSWWATVVCVCLFLESGAQAAQRHAALVDAGRTAALQDDGAVALEIGNFIRARTS